MDLNFLVKQLPRNRMHLKIYKDFEGLNMTNWDPAAYNNGGIITYQDVESIAAGLVFLDITKSAPSIATSYYQNPGNNGSVFEYNNISKSQLELSFWIHSFDHYSIMMNYRDVCSYFSGQALYRITTSYHPSLFASCVVNKIGDLTFKSQYDALFTVTLDNPLGLWFTDPSDAIETHYSADFNWQKKLDDLPVPGDVSPDELSWMLYTGHNNVMVLGDQLIKLSDPSMHVVMFVDGINGDVQIINHTTNTSLYLSAAAGVSSATWYDLDVRDGDNSARGLNQYTSGTDFWLSPLSTTNQISSDSGAVDFGTGGYNDIELIGANSLQLKTRFYFAHF